MKSKWFEYKDAAVALRKTGMSMTVIERKLGIPRSTLSGWFKHVPLTELQRISLMQNKQDGWLKARKNAAISHRAAKDARLNQAKNEAQESLNKIEINDSILDLAFAMLYFGEGAKNSGTSLASSDPVKLRFMITVLKKNYKVGVEDIRCELHLRMDQDTQTLKEHWSKELSIPIERFKYVAHDKRTTSKNTYPRYKGVCVIYCGNIAIQRKLIYLYTLFCEKITELGEGD